LIDLRRSTASWPWGKDALVSTLQRCENFFMLLSTKYDDQDASVVDKVLHCPEQMHRLCNFVSEGGAPGSIMDGAAES
jgi:hypothetical protein